ncbi:FBD-associated F-box protein At5g60610-like [Elaeis guineensis]|uniref:F-box/LRR-repeat protein At3g18150 n=1 Tax=Elaeis guineensis var. tenera TaxID=51953 RepID=A0A6I9Q9Y1_ELAGV|nr:putative F-box/LRR-repeat protein At3g18150 [Elaeis guineensis]
MAKPGGNAQVDRISDLSDDILIDILSFLPTNQAFQASILSRRWRYLPLAIPTLEFDERNSLIEKFNDWTMEDRYDVASIINLVLLSRRGAAIRTLRLFLAWYLFDSRGSAMVDRWIGFAMCHNVEELHIDITRCEYNLCYCPHSHHICRDGGYIDFYISPRSLFTYGSLRVLHLTGCQLHLASVVNFGCLETLSLSKVIAPEETLQHLIYCCPNIKNLSLEGCTLLKIITISNPHLRSFILRCCHDLEKVRIHAPVLRELEYKGEVGMLEKSRFSVTDSTDLASLNLDFCRALDSDDEFARLREFVGKFLCLKVLSLSSKHIMGLARTKDLFASVPFPFYELKRMELKGTANDITAIGAVVTLLKSTPSLEVLSLLFMPSTYNEQNQWEHDDEEIGHPNLQNVIKDEEEFGHLNLQNITTECLQYRLKRINIVHFKGHMVQRMLVKFLLGNAMALEKMFVAGGMASISHHLKVMEELLSWRANPLTEILYC